MQSYVNHKYENVPQQVEVEPKPKRRLTRWMNCGLLWTTKAINSGYGLPLMPRLVKLSVVILAIALATQLRNYGSRCLVSIANVRLFTLTSTRLIQLSCPANVIGLWAKKREKPTILRDSTVRYDNECQGWLERLYPFLRS